MAPCMSLVAKDICGLRKSTETCDSTSLHLLNPPSRQLTNQGNQCDHTWDISTRINLVSDGEQIVDCQG
ncbi:unnamed protein product [Boreogadus saida]